MNLKECYNCHIVIVFTLLVCYCYINCTPHAIFSFVWFNEASTIMNCILFIRINLVGWYLGHRTPITSKLSVSQNSRGTTQMEVSYERGTSPPNSRRSSGASVTGTTLSRKNSVTGTTTTTLPYSPAACDSSTEASTPNRFHARHRSPSPSIRLPAPHKQVSFIIKSLDRISIKRNKF